jgi:hypothetical protein
MYVVSFDIGIRNLAYCILEYNELNKSHTLMTWRTVDLNAKRHDLQGLVDSLIDLLDTILYDEIPDISQSHIQVLIEYQMTAVMKCLQTAVSVFFKMIKKYNNEVSISTAFVSPKLKLKMISQYPEYLGLEKQDNISTKYKKNKIDSVMFATWLLKYVYKDAVALDVLQSHKKNDDLSDVYLQALAWLHAYKSI